MMDETFTFVSTCGRFEFTVKKAFAKRVSVADYDVYDLMTKYNMAEHLHNPRGPAIVHLGTDYKEAWMDGKQLSKEESEKFFHGLEFYNRVITDIIGEENE